MSPGLENFLPLPEQDQAEIELLRDGPFSSVSAPNAAVTPQNHPSKRRGSFTSFAYLPAELRVQIWQNAVPGPRVIHVNYDTLTPNYSHSRSFTQTRGGTWAIASDMTGDVSPLSIQQVCQESRAEARKVMGTYTRMEMRDKLSCWINFDIDAVFLNTDADKHNYIRKQVLPPSFPVYAWKYRHELKYLAIGDSLWEKWHFEEDWGTDVTCDCCGGYGRDNTWSDFLDRVKFWAEKCPAAERLQIVRRSRIADSDDADICFKPAEYIRRGRTVATSDFLLRQDKDRQMRARSLLGDTSTVEVEIVEIDWSHGIVIPSTSLSDLSRKGDEVEAKVEETDESRRNILDWMAGFDDVGNTFSVWPKEVAE
jgi:hypothetical protein